MSNFFATKTAEKGRTELGNEFSHSINKTRLNNTKKFFLGRIVKNEQIISAVPGIYTWILRGSGNIYASKTVTKQEIGTLHQNLDLLTTPFDASPIIAAGEFEKNPDGSINFNLLSGSYMAKRDFKKIRGESDDLYKARAIGIRDELIRKINTYLPKEMNFKFLKCSTNDCSLEEQIAGKNIIATKNIRTSNRNLAELNSILIRTGGRRTRKMYRRKQNRKVYRKTRKQ